MLAIAIAYSWGRVRIGAIALLSSVALAILAFASLTKWMRRRSCRRVRVCHFLIALSALLGPLVLGRASAQLIDLGTLPGGSFSGAFAVSNGQVVGNADTASGAEHAFSWTQAGGMVDLGTLGGSTSEASAVSNGQVVGTTTNASGPDARAFSWTQAGGMVDLGTLPGGSASEVFFVDGVPGAAVSNGQVVGRSATDATGDFDAFSWTQAGGMVDLGTLGGTGSEAYAVSNGQVVGLASTASDDPHAFSWTQAGGMVDLGTLGGSTSEALAVSNGQVVGDATTASDAFDHAFSWTQAGGMIDLGTLGGSNSVAVAVSNGQVVGHANIASGAEHAFSWTQAGGMVDLGTLGGSSSEALAVSNGQVVGDATTNASSDDTHAFSWTQAGGMVDLGTLGGATSEAFAVSNGQVVGEAATNASGTFRGATHAFSTTPLVTITLVDPVPGLLDTSTGSRITADTTALASKGRLVSGVGADGVSRVVVRIPASSAGEQFAVSLLNDQGHSSSSSNEDGGLGQISDISFTRQSVIVTAASTTPPMAFAVYQAPVDFPRPLNISDPAASSRMVTIEAQPLPTGALGNLSVAILRPPVVLVHGIWGDASNWNGFLPFTNDPQNRFYLERADYSNLIGSRITVFLPDDADALGLLSGIQLTNHIHKFARAHSLGFSYNAKSVLDNIFVAVNDFKFRGNPASIAVAAVQADIVAHSMGGDISRYLPLLPNFYLPGNFSQGEVHKVITIDTPHLGSPLPFGLLQGENQCLRDLFMFADNMAFAAVTLDSAKQTTPGAACELSENVSGMSLCNTLQQIHDPSTRRLPTALIAAAMGSAQLDRIDDFHFKAFAMRRICSGDPLAADLTSALWPTVFGGDSDAIVSLDSQLDGLAGTAFTNAVHSAGTEVLGFGGPNVLEQASGVPQQVIDLLNIPVTDTSTYQALP